MSWLALQDNPQKRGAGADAGPDYLERLDSFGAYF